MRNYNDKHYTAWRKAIRLRDKHTCQWPNCFSKKKIQVHHILPWSQYPGLRYHLDNGICLCKTHHNFIKNDETTYANLFLNLLYSKKIHHKGDSDAT